MNSRRFSGAGALQSSRQRMPHGPWGGRAVLGSAPVPAQSSAVAPLPPGIEDKHSGTDTHTGLFALLESWGKDSWMLLPELECKHQDFWGEGGCVLVNLVGFVSVRLFVL